MSIFSKEKGLYDAEIELISESEDCHVYKMISDGGDGIMTTYQVYPGIELIYTDFHMGNCFHNKRPCQDIMEINHCREGRFECDFKDGSCVYLGEGDLSVNMLNNCTKNSCFPLEHYHGVSVVIDMAEAAQTISSVLSDISIDLYELQDKLCSNNRCFIMRAKDSIEHIFSELYRIPDNIKKSYFKLKVLELLLFLSIIDISEKEEQRIYFHKSQVELIKTIKEYMTSNLEHHYTLEELSTQFKIPQTALKLCFKGVYGTPIYAFMRTYRIKEAAQLLKKSSDSIAIVAGKVGYVNSSKFASAFKAVIGESPLKYRRELGVGSNFQ
jgi:AraC-like DNA-binding protein